MKRPISKRRMYRQRYWSSRRDKLRRRRRSYRLFRFPENMRRFRDALLGPASALLDAPVHLTAVEYARRMQHYTNTLFPRREQSSQGS